jgi:hypothetical protein
MDEMEYGDIIPAPMYCHVCGFYDCSCPTTVATRASDRQVGGSHYKDLAIQPNEYIYANGLNWFAGNIVKYATRAGRKDGREGMIKDLRKAIHYTELWLERIESEGEVE